MKRILISSLALGAILALSAASALAQAGNGRPGSTEAGPGIFADAANHRATLFALKDKCNGSCLEVSAIAGALAVFDGPAPPPGAAPISAAKRYNQGVDFLAAKNYAEAIAAFNDVLAQKPDDYEAAYLKGQAEAASGDNAAARLSFQLALKLQPGLVDAKGRLGAVEKKLGNTAAAAEIRAGLVKSQEKCAGTCAGAKPIADAIAMIDAG